MEKITVVIKGGNLVGVYSSMPDTSIDFEVIDFDNAKDMGKGYVKMLEDKLQSEIETGIIPYTLY